MECEIITLPLGGSRSRGGEASRNMKIHPPSGRVANGAADRGEGKVTVYFMNSCDDFARHK